MRARARARARACVLLALAALAACAAPPAPLRSEIDPRTAVTTQSMGEPWVYAREATELAVHARDYLSVGVVEVNRQGRRTYFLGVVAWSTVDRSGVPGARVPLPAELELEGRRAPLAPLGHDAKSIGVSLSLFRPATGYAGETWYALQPEDVRALANHRPAWVEFVHEDVRQRFEHWRGGPELLAPLVERMP